MLFRSRDRLQDIHFQACKKARPDPVALAKRLFDWGLHSELGVFFGAIEQYSEILGASGLQAYRQLAEKEWRKVPTRTAKDERAAWGSLPCHSRANEPNIRGLTRKAVACNAEAGEFQLHFRFPEFGGHMRAEPLRRDRLVFGRLADTPYVDLNPFPRCQRHADHRDPSRRLPRHAGQEAGQYVRLHPVPPLVPNRPESEIRLLNRERRYIALCYGAPADLQGGRSSLHAPQRMPGARACTGRLKTNQLSFVRASHITETCPSDQRGAISAAELGLV